MIDFSTLQYLTIPEGVVTKIMDADGNVLWEGGRVVLEVEKITSNTYDGATSYIGEQFILLDIYPKTNGTVKVTYGGLTKTITDTSGAAEPSAQKVHFGTFNGVSDSVVTPAIGMLTIEGNYRGFGVGSFFYNDDKDVRYYNGISEVDNWGRVSIIPSSAFRECTNLLAITIPSHITRLGSNVFMGCYGLKSVTISAGVTNMGMLVFNGCYALENIKVLATTPPDANSMSFYVDAANAEYLTCTVTVPKGCGEAYKAAEHWVKIADRIVEDE